MREAGRREWLFQMHFLYLSECGHFAGSVVLCSESREGVPEILYRHIGERINLYGCCKSGHDGCAEAVDKALNHEDTEIHDRLLDAGQ